jgi:eukaryotic-like serine/threonine-protein kinase
MAALEVPLSSSASPALPRMEGTEAASGARGKYCLIAELGHGGMARVFLALVRGPQGFNKLAVIKQIRENLAHDHELLAMFLDEARLSARLNHPNVVQTNEVCRDGEAYFIGMEYLEGQPLKRIIQRLDGEGGIPLGFHLQILIETLSGLHHAHELTDYDGTPLHVVHRDVSPSNVFVTYAGQVKVVDFGIAKALCQSTETKLGVVKGKIAYMAPEQARGDEVDRRADLFSVGVMMWEALAGRRMFEGLDNLSIIQEMIRGQFPSPRSVRPTIDNRLDAVCMKALAPDRDDRYATAADFQRAIEQALDALGDRSNLRDAGKLISYHFEPERARIKALVEATLSRGLDGRTFNEWPSAEAGAIHGTASTSRILPVILDPPACELVSRDDRASWPTLHHADSGTLAEVAFIASVPPPGPIERRKSKLVLPLAIASVAAALAMGYVAIARIETKREPAQATPAPVPHTLYTLKLESSPPGATVKEGDKTLGKTPMAISLDGRQKDARVLVISLDGFIDYTLWQESASADVEITVMLTRNEAPGLTSTMASPRGPPTGVQRHEQPIHRTRAGATAVQPVVPPPPSSTGEINLDINLTR